MSNAFSLRWVWPLFLLSWVSPAFGSVVSPFLIEGIEEVYTLNEHVEVLLDPDARLNLEMLRQEAMTDGFQPLSQLVLKSRHTYWARIEIRNTLPSFTLHEYFLYVGRADSIEVFVPDGTGAFQTLRTGSLYAVSQRDLSSGAQWHRVRLSIQPLESKVIYLRFRDVRGYVPQIDLQLRRNEAFGRWEQLVEKQREGIFFGFLLTMILFNLTMFGATKDKPFLFHSLYVLGILIFNLDLHFVLHNFGPYKAFPFSKNLINYLSVTMMDIAYLIFVRYYIQLKERMPLWNRIFSYLIGLRILILVGVTFYYLLAFHESFTDQLMAVSFFVEYNLLLPVFLVALFRKKDRVGYYLIAGTLLLLIDVALVVGLIIADVEVLRFKYLIYLGVVGEITMFTLGLGFRLRTLRTRQAEAERLQELNDLKSRFYTNITHEFRTPITVILGMADQLRTRALGPVQERELLSAIQHNSHHLLNLVNQMLDLARLESGKIKLKNRLADIVGFLGYLTDSFHSLAASKDISFSMRSSLEQFQMDFDAEKMQQVVANLVSNAIKFTPSGGRVTLFAEVEKNFLGEERFVLQLHDTGIGIPEDKLPYIFDRFFQADSTDSRLQQGTGIGLSLVKELVYLMGGEIEVKSILGQGTEFILSFRVTRSAPPQERLPEKWETDLTSVATAKSLSERTFMAPLPDAPTILVVEDNPDVVQYLKVCLEGIYQVEVAMNGVRGLEKALEIIPDLVVSDVMMPEMDGYALCEQLKTEPLTSHIPLILLTAKAADEDRIFGLKKGADAYLTKPFIQEELLVRIHNLLTQREKLKQHYRQFLEEGHPDPEAIDPEKRLLGNILQVIEGRLSDESFNAEALAQELLMSRTQLYRKLESLTAQKPAQLIRDLRMQKAKELLETTYGSVGEIGLAVGYAEPSYFTKVFKEHFQGITPSEAKRLIQLARDWKKKTTSLSGLAQEVGYESLESLKAAYQTWFGEALEDDT